MSTTLPASFGVAQKIAEPQKKPEDFRLIKLSNLLGSADLDSNHRCAALLSQRVDLNQRIDHFLRDEARKADAALRAQWEECKGQARELQERIGELKGKQSEVLQRWNRANQAQAIASARWGDAKAARESLSKFASAEQVKAADMAVEKARAEYEQKERETGELFAERNRLSFLEPPLTGRLAELGIKEVRLLAQVTGQTSYLDPEFGLVLEPGAL
jgi:hypothetical protein